MIHPGQNGHPGEKENGARYLGLRASASRRCEQQSRHASAQFERWRPSRQERGHQACLRPCVQEGMAIPQRSELRPCLRLSQLLQKLAANDSPVDMHRSSSFPSRPNDEMATKLPIRASTKVDKPVDKPSIVVDGRRESVDIRRHFPPARPRAANRAA